MGQPGQVGVVVADHRHVLEHPDAGPEEHVEQADGAAVVGRDDGGGQLGAVQQHAGRSGAVGGEAVAAQPRQEAGPAVGGHRPAVAVDVRDPPVSQPDEVVHGLADALVVGHPDDGEGGGREVAAQHDHRHPLPQLPQPVDVELGGEQHERFAAQVEQGLDDPLLVVARGDRAQRDGVAGGVGGQLQLLGQFRAEGVAQHQRHAQHRVRRRASRLALRSAR